MGAVPARVTLITLGVADLARATAFYASLGWEVSPDSQESVTFLRTNGPLLSLYGREALADDAQVSPAGDGFRAVTLGINLGSPAEVDAAVAAWTEAGGSVVKPPETVFWGGYSGYVADLDGHLWEIAHNPYMTLDDRGLPLSV